MLFSLQILVHTGKAARSINLCCTFVRDLCLALSSDPRSGEIHSQLRHKHQYKMYVGFMLQLYMEINMTWHVLRHCIWKVLTVESHELNKWCDEGRT